jgi:hypothetical protein
MAKLFCGDLGVLAFSQATFDQLDGSSLFEMMTWCRMFDDGRVAGPTGLAVVCTNVSHHDHTALYVEVVVVVVVVVCVCVCVCVR